MKLPVAPLLQFTVPAQLVAFSSTVSFGQWFRLPPATLIVGRDGLAFTVTASELEGTLSQPFSVQVAVSDVETVAVNETAFPTDPLLQFTVPEQPSAVIETVSPTQ